MYKNDFHFIMEHLYYFLDRVYKMTIGTFSFIIIIKYLQAPCGNYSYYSWYFFRETSGNSFNDF